MIEVRVLEFDRLGKAYVVDPKTLNVYETESIEGNPYCMYEKSEKLSMVAALIICLLFIALLKLYLISKIIAIVGYILLLLLGFVYFAKFISYQDKYFYDTKNLEIVDKTKNVFLIVNFTNNILKRTRKIYFECLTVSIVLVAGMMLFLLVKEYFNVMILSSLLVLFVSILFFNKEWQRIEIMKRLLASLEQE